DVGKLVCDGLEFGATGRELVVGLDGSLGQPVHPLLKSLQAFLGTLGVGADLEPFAPGDVRERHYDRPLCCIRSRIPVSSACRSRSRCSSVSRSASRIALASSMRGRHKTGSSIRYSVTSSSLSQPHPHSLFTHVNRGKLLEESLAVLAILRVKSVFAMKGGPAIERLDADPHPPRVVRPAALDDLQDHREVVLGELARGD